MSSRRDDANEESAPSRLTSLLPQTGGGLIHPKKKQYRKRPAENETPSIVHRETLERHRQEQQRPIYCIPDIDKSFFNLDLMISHWIKNKKAFIYVF